MNKKYQYLILVLLVLLSVQGNAQEWLVPAEEEALVNPMEYELENVKKGKELYITNCKNCHGDPGKNNALAMEPLPPDISSSLLQSNTDGGLFYKISTGRGVMQSFAPVISETGRWQIVNFIRNYSPDFTTLLSDLPPVKAMLKAALNNEKTAITVYAESEGENGAFTSLKNTPVLLFSKKTFGNLGIGEALTDETGKAELKIPEHLIGDEEGLVNFVITLNDDYDAKAVELSGSGLGSIKEHTPLIRKGVLWSTNDNMPLWLVFSFFGMVAAAWITIGYVVLQIIKIRKYGRQE